MRFTTLPGLLLLSLVQWASAEPLGVDRRVTPVYRWMNPFPEDGLVRRQSGYHPEFGGCDYTGETCEEACGGGYEECQAGTELALFCYDPTRDQTCCHDDSGRACDRDFYCAKGVDRTWCCPNGLSLRDCEALFQQDLTSVEPNPSRTPSNPSSRTSSGRVGSATATTTETETQTETVTVGGGTILSTTIFAPLTQIITETLTITVTDGGAGSERIVTLTSEITIVTTQAIVLGGPGGAPTGAPCQAGEACTAVGPVVVASTTSRPVVISEGGAVRAASEGFGMAVLGFVGFVNWALVIAL